MNQNQIQATENTENAKPYQPFVVSPEKDKMSFSPKPFFLCDLCG